MIVRSLWRHYTGSYWMAYRLPMNKLSVFALTLGTSIVGLIASFYLLFINYEYSPSETYTSGMMSGHMVQSVRPEPPLYLWLLPPIFIAVFTVGAVGFTYFYMVSKAKHSKILRPAADEVLPLQTAPPEDKFSTILKTLTPAEAKVFNILVVNGGKYLQKHISKETGLSKLKVHKIITRFVERGIVTVERFGNTNEVALCEWLTSNSRALESDKLVAQG